MPSGTRRQRPTPDIWPGFVDAFSALLIIIIFLLMVFTLAQYFLTEALSGRDEALQRLNKLVAELQDTLSLEKRTAEELRRNLAQVSDELQASIATRDQLSSQLGELLPERDALKALLTTRTAELAAMTERAAAAERQAAEAESRANKVARELEDAFKTIDADKETIEAKLAEIASLMRDLGALRTVRADLEKKVAGLARTLELNKAELVELAERYKAGQLELTATSGKYEETRDKLKALSGKYSASQQQLETLTRRHAAGQKELESLNKTYAVSQTDIDKLTKQLAESQRRLDQQTKRADGGQTALVSLRGRFKLTQAQLAKLNSQYASSQQQTARLTQANEASRRELTALRDRSKELVAKLSTAEERTALSQRTIEKTEIRLKEALANSGTLAGKLTEEQKISEAARRQVALLNRQISELRKQLARIENALEISESKSKEQRVQIANLGKRLNLALVSKVEELSRYRSEFFGRLRQVLGNRKDIRVVGDRFVFQSEVLFASGSATLSNRGQVQLARLTRTLIQISKSIPTGINWVLRVDGHTDKVPIASARFPSNWELSAERAISVVKFMTGRGIRPSRLVAAGFGEFHPIDPRDDEIGYRRNRRIEFKLTER